MKKIKIAVSCGESSGDLNGAYLIETLNKKYNNFYFYGIGGKRLKEAGCDVLFESDQFGTIGVIQSLKVVLKLTFIYHKFKRILIKDKPDLLLCIDFGFFNSKLIKAAYTFGINNIYYFPPASWKKNLKHANALVESESKVITPFPWSEKILQNFGLEAKFLGHPLLDLAKANISKEEFYKKNNINENNKIIGFLPGSRNFEINMHIPPYADTINKLYEENSNYIFLIASSNSNNEFIKKKLKNLCPKAFNNIRVIPKEAYNIMTFSEFLFCCSGTATLEASIIGTPMVILYKGTSLMKLEYLIRKKGLPTIIGMPNIIMDKYVVPELISDNVNSNEMIKQYRIVMNKKEEIQKDFKEIRSILGESPVIDKIADTFLQMSNLK